MTIQGDTGGAELNCHDYDALDAYLNGLACSPTANWSDCCNGALLTAPFDEVTQDDLFELLTLIGDGNAQCTGEGDT